jgi:hypothetical protein
MRLKVVDTFDDVKEVKFNPEWELVSTSFGYMDFDRRLWDHPLTDGESVYYMQRLTLVSEGNNGDWTYGYTYFVQNNPDGNHNTTAEIRITLEVALGLLGAQFKEEHK